VQVRSAEQLSEVRALFLEYWQAFSFDPCFQGFETEVATLPGDYAQPAGRLALATLNERVAGCIALRSLSREACEMKRLYVRDAFRNRGVGRALVQWLLDEARTIGYAEICLDTMPSMTGAISMYERLGFTRCDPYGEEPSDGAICFRRPL
jgi:putative acetyltransferase